jgi:hypothetical protein
MKSPQAKMSMNPFCEIAVEEGIRLKEKGVVKELVALSIGADKCQDTLKQALAMGADRAVFLKTPMRTDQELQPLVRGEYQDMFGGRKGAAAAGEERRDIISDDGIEFLLQ